MKGLLAGSAEIKAGLKRQASEGGAYRVAFHPEGPPRKRNRVYRSRAAHLNGPDYRPIIVDFAKSTRTINAGENKLFAGDELPSGFRAH